MGKILAVVNQKGGVGKTTTCVNVCCALKKAGRRVLLCDADPQGNATSAMGLDKTSISAGTYSALTGAVSPRDAVFETEYGDVMPSNRELAGAGIELVAVENREFVLRSVLDALRNDYDYIFIDCPPSLEMLTLNAICAADSVLIPVQCEYLALEGLSDLVGTMRIVRRSYNHTLEIEGVILTMFDGRTNLSFEVADEVKKYFKDKVYRTAIPRNVRLSEAPSHGKPVIAYDFSSKGSRAYLDLAEEIISRSERKGNR